MSITSHCHSFKIPTLLGTPARTWLQLLLALCFAATVPASAHENLVGSSASKSHQQPLKAADNVVDEALNSLPGSAVYKPMLRAAEQYSKARGGSWSDVEPWPVLAVHANLLPNGKVLAWDATPDDFDEDPHTAESYTTRVTVWDPVTKEHLRANNNTDTDLFCAGSAQLWDGRVLFAGGDSEPNGLNGPLSNTNIYDYVTNAWERADNMAAARWYSSVAALSNGEMLTFGGSFSPNPIGEVFQLDKRWRSLDLKPPYSLSGEYQWLQSAPDGSVLYFGPHDLISTINTSDSGSWETNTVRDGYGYRGYGSYAMYDVGQVLIAGGGDSSRSSVIVDAMTKATRATGSMQFGRRQHNLTILADGSVLSTGGNYSGSDLIDLYTGVFTPEIWQPETGQWQSMNDMAIDRQYHSIALLLPSGEVLSAGGGYCGLCNQLSYHEQNAEIYSPPYLFNADSTPASRPGIQWAPDAVNYASRFEVQLGSARTIDKVHLIKLGSVTHSENQDQRLIPLSYTQNGPVLSISSPSHRNIAPPGHYMLFVVQGKVPSVASIVRVGQPLMQSGELLRNTIRAGEQHVYAFDVSAGQQSFSAVMGALSGDLDLVVREGIPPMLSDADANQDCVSRNPDSTSESCLVSTTQAGNWYVAVQAHAASNYSLLLSANMSAGANDLLSAFDDAPVNVMSPHTPISQQLIPTVPTNLRGRIYSPTSGEVFWEASIDNGAVRGYEVYRDDVLVRRFDARSYFQNDLQPGRTYRYSVLAYDDEGNNSARSPVWSMTVPAQGDTPAAIAGVVQPGADAITEPPLEAAIPAPVPQPEPAPQPVPEPEPEPQPEPAPEPVPEPTPEPTNDIVFRLIDADADRAIDGYRNLQNGSEIFLSQLPSQQLNMEAVVSGVATITRVRFDFDDREGIANERFHPYALFGDITGNYTGFPIGVGSHTVTARVFSGSTEVRKRSVRFEVKP